MGFILYGYKLLYKGYGPVSCFKAVYTDFRLINL